MKPYFSIHITTCTVHGIFLKIECDQLKPMIYFKGLAQANEASDMFISMVIALVIILFQNIHNCNLCH